MTLYINTPASNATVTVNSIGNIIEGPVGQSPQGISGGNTDEGYYTVEIPWNVNLNGTLYNSVYVSTNSFMAFGSPAITGSPTIPQTDKIFLGNRKNTTVPDTYAKNFYPIFSGPTGNRTLRLRYEGGFKTDPLNQSSTEISYTLLGRQSLQSYTYTNGFIEIQLPWNVNFNIRNGEIQNTIQIYTSSFILFGKGEVSNGNFVFTSLNELDLGFSGIIDGTVGGVWAGIEGTSPNRTYRVRFEADDLFSTNTVVWEMILYENNKNIIDVHIGHLPNIISMGWFGQSKFFDLTNTSGDYKFRGTRFSQEYGNSSLVWESTFYENNINRIDVQLGEKYDDVGLQVLTWTLRTSGTTSSFSAVTYGGDYYVSALSGPTGNITVSTNGINWTYRTSTQTQINSIASGFVNGQNVYVSGGPSGRVTYSTDTIVWTLRTSAFGSGSDAILSLGFYKNLFLAVGGGQGTPVISTSTNGIIWSRRTSANFNPSDNGGLIYDVSYSNNEFLTCGTGIAASTDAIHWARRTLPPTVGNYIAIGSGNGISVSGNLNSNLITSTDNIVWAEITPSPVSAFITDIQYLSGYYVVAQSLSTSLLVSTNALSWYNVPAFGSDITYGNNKFVAVGNAVYTGVLESPLSTLNYYYGVYSKNSSLYDFLSDKFAGYSILSSFTTSVWTQPQSVYAKLTPLGLSSQWQRIRNIYARDSDIWKLIQPPPGPVYLFCRRSTYQNDTYGNKGGTGIASFQNESFVVPNGVTTITAEMWGGGGSGGAALNGGDSNTAVSGAGGGGGYVKATLSVTPGETLTIRVGGGGWQYAANVVRHPNLTISGLSNNNIQMVSRRSDNSLLDQDLRGGIGGSGGGYSAIFRGLTPLVVAGGGGGGGGTVGYFVGSLNGDNAIGGNGGAGGGDIGQSGTNGNSISGNATNGGKGGGGGTQSTGGAGGAGPTASTCISSDAESGSYLTGGRGKNNPEYQGNLSGSTLIPDNGTASNPGTNGGAAGGGSARTRNAVCNSTGIGIPNFDPNSLYSPSSCGGGGGGGYYGGGGGGVGRYNSVFEDTSVGGGGGGGGSNYVGGALSVISNSQGSGRVPGNTTSPYYLTSYLYAPQTNVPGVPFNSFAQGGVGYGGESGIAPILDQTIIYYGSRGENGLVIIYW